MSSIAVIGAGSWGTALAHSFAEAGHAVKLWAYEKEVVESILHKEENSLFFPGVCLNKQIEAVSDLEKAITGADFVLTVMPSHVCRALFERMLPFLTPTMTLVSATKGLETDSLMRMSEVIHDVVGRRFKPRLAVLSGPSFAYEVAHGDPTAIVVASNDSTVAQSVQAQFSSKGLRLYSSDLSASRCCWQSQSRCSTNSVASMRSGITPIRFLRWLDLTRVRVPCSRLFSVSSI